MMEDYFNLFIELLKAIIIAGTILRVIQILMKCQTEGVSLKEGFVNVKRVIKAGIIAILLPSIIPIINNSYLKGLNEQQPYIGVINLIYAMIKMFIVLEPFIISYKTVEEIMLYKLKEDGMEKEHKNNAIRIVVAGVLIMGATVFIGILFNYYR